MARKMPNITESKSAKKGKHNKKLTGKKGGRTLMMASAAGATAGAIIGGLAAAALVEEQNRKAVGKIISELPERASTLMQTISDASGQLKDTTTKLAQDARVVKERAALKGGNKQD